MRDFDKFFQEMEKEPVKFKLYGKEEALPPGLPAEIILKLNRAYKEHGDNKLPESVQFDLAFSVFGEEKVEEWCKRGLTIDQLAELIKWATEELGTGNKKGGKKG